MQKIIRVSLLGKNPVIRSGLGRVLVEQNFVVCQSVDNPMQLTEDCASHDMLVVIDSEIDHGDASELAALHRRYQTLKMVVLSDHFNFDSMIRAYAAGVYGYLIKELSFEPLIVSLRLIATGEKVMPTRLVEELLLRTDRESSPQVHRTLEQSHLSVSEVRILNCLMMGYSNKAISHHLSVCEATVKMHVKAVLRKLHVKNRTQAAILAMNGHLAHAVTNDTDHTAIGEITVDGSLLSAA